MIIAGTRTPLATAGRRAVPGAVGVVSRIRTEQRRLEWLLEDLNPLETPERVLTLLEDALLSLRDAGAQLRRQLDAAADGDGHECARTCHASHRLEHMPVRDL